MVKKVNEVKDKFKKLFLESLKEVEPNSFISDYQLKETCLQHGLNLKLPEIQQCIRSLEAEIGAAYKLRAARIKNEGYKILIGDEQYFKANDEGRNKLVRACKKTAKRLKNVDLTKCSNDIKETLNSKSMAVTALAQILKATFDPKKFTVKDVSVITAANNELKALAHLRGDNN